MTSMVQTGNMRSNLSRQGNSKLIDKDKAAQALEEGKNILAMKAVAISPTFSNLFFGRASGGGTQGRTRQYRGQDYNSELQIKLSDVYKTHQQILTINGKQVRITIPAGIENGQTIRLRGYGSRGVNGGPNGDLYITFAITNDTNYVRKGNDLELSLPIDLYTAMLGGEVTVDTMSGKVKLKVAPETQNGTKTRLKGKGFPVYKKEGEYGDLYITYQVVLPTNLTDKQKQLFEELKNTKN